MLDPTIARLIEARIPGQRYGVFFSTGEGSFFPNGREESSGAVVAEDGEHYDYWTGWDAERGVERFDTWQHIDDDRDGWMDDAEYRAARRVAGLD